MVSTVVVSTTRPGDTSGILIAGGGGVDGLGIGFQSGSFSTYPKPVSSGTSGPVVVVVVVVVMVLVTASSTASLSSSSSTGSMVVLVLNGFISLGRGIVTDGAGEEVTDGGRGTAEG